MSKTFKDYLQEAGAPDYNPAAGKYSSNMEYGMFTPEGDAEVEEIVNDACEMVKRGTVDAMGAVDAAQRMLMDLAEMTDFEEADDTDVRDRVAREIMSRCDELGESEMNNKNEAYSPGDENEQGKVSNCCGAPIMDVYKGHGRCSDCKEMASAVNEAVGDAAAPLYDLIDAHGAEAVLDELARYLDVDQIEDFVSDYRRHHEMDMDEAAVDENAFNQAAAAAARAGKDSFEFGGKTHKTTMNKTTAHKLDDDVDYLKKLAGL